MHKEILRYNFNRGKDGGLILIKRIFTNLKNPRGGGGGGSFFDKSKLIHGRKDLATLTGQGKRDRIYHNPNLGEVNICRHKGEGRGSFSEDFTICGKLASFSGEQHISRSMSDNLKRPFL